MMGYWFRFEIPRHEDGTIAIYPRTWHGVLDQCPRNVTVHLYNDKDAYGLAYAEDKFIPLEVKVMSEFAAAGLMAEAMMGDQEQVWLGERLEHRWDVVEEVTDGR